MTPGDFELAIASRRALSRHAPFVKRTGCWVSALPREIRRVRARKSHADLAKAYGRRACLPGHFCARHPPRLLTVNSLRVDCLNQKRHSHTQRALLDSTADSTGRVSVVVLLFQAVSSRADDWRASSGLCYVGLGLWHSAWDLRVGPVITQFRTESTEEQD